MRCPKCGKEIEEGSLFCTYCFADIRIVPTYDSKVEQAVSEALEDVGKRVERETNREKSRKERHEQLARSKRKLYLVLFGAAAGILLMAAAFLLFGLITGHSESYYVASAYNKASGGNYAGAAEDIKEALTLAGNNSARVELLLTKSEYEARAGQDEAAIETLQALIDAAMDSSEVLSAYSRMIEIYSARDEYATIARILRECGSEEVQSSFRQYMAEVPVFDLPSGSYDDNMQVVLSASGDGSIFYTLDGTRPSTNSSMYVRPLTLPPGFTRVTAIYINRYGVASRTSTHLYYVEDEEKEEDETTEETPDTEDRHVITDAEGASLIVQALIGIGEPMLQDGTVENGLARFVYIAQGRETLAGQIYYTYIEMMQDTAGNSIYTGRRFAVDITDGSVGCIDENANVIPIG